MEDNSTELTPPGEDAGVHAGSRSHGHALVTPAAGLLSRSSEDHDSVYDSQI